MRILSVIKSLLGLKSVLMSLMVVSVVGALIGGGLYAYFSDTETSEGNTFSAGTIDIGIYGAGYGMENPWYSGPYEYNMQNLMPSDICSYEQDGRGCEEPGWLQFLISNEGTNPADVWKRITVTGRDTGILAYPDPQMGPVSSEPEYAAEGAEWTGEGWDAEGWYPIDDIETTTLYDMYAELYSEEGRVYPVPNYDPPYIYDQYDCEDYWDGYYDDPDGEPGTGDETCTLYYVPMCIIPEYWGVFVAGEYGEDSIDGQWIYLGDLRPGEQMYVGQSYRLYDWGYPQDEYQGDNFTFTIEIYAQQTTGDVGPPEPYWYCPYYYEWPEEGPPIY
jgi:predicted ribosomally synthesized peptide with SipW-like signal peptide